MNLDGPLYLQRKGLLTPERNKILDIGPQNVYFARDEQIREFVASQGQTISDANLEKEIQRLVYFSTPRPEERTTLFSEIADLTNIEYNSIDVCPGLKTEILDLNFDKLPKYMVSRYDVVLNFGTTEHIFNQWNCFEVMHDATKVGGVIYHQLPASGYLDHGYYCYTPLFFREMAEANGYEILDLFVTPAGESKIDQLEIQTRTGNSILDRLDHLSQDNRIPALNIHVILRKTRSSGFRCALEIATAHSPVNEAMAARYKGNEQVGTGSVNRERTRNWRSWRDVQRRIRNALRQYHAARCSRSKLGRVRGGVATSVTDHKLDTARDLTWREPLPDTAGVRAMLSAILTFMLRRMRRLSFALTVRAFSFSDRLGRCILHFSLLKERVDPDAPWHNPESLSSAWLISRFPRETAFVSLQIAASDTFLIPHAVSAWRQLDTTRLESMASSYFEIGRFHRAKEALECAAVLHFRSPYFSYMLGSLYLLAGDESKAAACARDAVKLDPGYLAPSEYFFLTTDKSPPYRPTQYDTAFGEEGLLRSLYDSTGQRVLHVGAGQLRPLLHSKAMEKRAILRTSAQPSPSLARFLSERNIDFRQMHVLPWEWTSQIGHLGMLEIMLRMRKLGWWEGHAILLTHENQIANRTFLSLLEEEAGLTIISDSHNDVSRELASLLPSHGMPYYAWRYPNAQVVPWHEAAALAICEWERQNLGYPLRGVYDRKFGDDISIVEKARDAFSEWGIGPNDWYVCVHMREPSYIGADADRGQNNRNANPDNYEEALRYITSQGGWVLKLGAPQSPPLPEMERVVDYARSRHKSDSLDIYLIRHAKFFVGTTSGLVNVAVSFGLPTAQVNCLTTESQLWHSGVRFCLKPIVRADGRILTQKEVISSQWRWGLFTVDTMRYYNLTARDNSSDEILETVREVHSIAGGAKYVDGAEDVRLREQWKNSLEVRHHYGCALPSAYFLRKHRMRMLD